MSKIDKSGNLEVEGQIVAGGGLKSGAAYLSNADVLANADIARSKLAQDTLAEYAIPWESWRVHDAFGTLIPATPASDDLGLVGGTFGSASPSLQTGDLKAAGATTRYARATLHLPPEYDDGQTVLIRFHAGMLTTVSDTTATVDVEVYESDKEAGVGSDLVTTSATSINSLTLADKDFTVTASGLVAGDLLDIRVAIAVNDAATGTAVTGIIGYAAVLMDIRG